jgi:hypothetical protein
MVLHVRKSQAEGFEMGEPRDVELTIRLTPEQFRLLRDMAEQRELSPEAMAQLLLASELNREFFRDARLHSLKSEVLEEQQELIMAKRIGRPSKKAATREERLDSVKRIASGNSPVGDWEAMERDAESRWDESPYNGESEK